VKTRRIYWLLWLLFGAPTLFMGFLLVPPAALELAWPGRRQWKTRLVTAVFGAFALVALGNVLLFGNVYFGAAAVAYLALTAVTRLRRTVFWLTLGGTLWLVAAALTQPWFGPAGGLVAAVVLAVAGVVVARRPGSRDLAAGYDDTLVLFFQCSLVVLSVFFFLPSPVPSRWLERQPGVSVVAAVDRGGAYRDTFLFHQVHMADELDEASLVVTAKRRLPGGVTRFRSYRLDATTGAMSEAPFTRPVTAAHLLRCAPDEILPAPDETAPDALAPQRSGYCLPDLGVYLVGTETRVGLLDRSSGVLVSEFPRRGLGSRVPLRFFAPYRDGPLASFHNDVLSRVTFDATTGAVTEQPVKAYREPLMGETSLVGDADYPDVFLVKTSGSVRRIDPVRGRIVAEGDVWPGFRFVTFDPRLELLLVVNDLLGVVEVLDARTMRRLDVVYVGHAARRVNLSWRTPGRAYVVSAVGVLRLDFCERLPGRCAEAQVSS